MRLDICPRCRACANPDCCEPCLCPDEWANLPFFPEWARKPYGTRRPGGRWYRPRKGLAASTYFDWHDEHEYLYVLRTHNRELAWWWLHQVRIVVANSAGYMVPTTNWSCEGDPGMLEFGHLAWLRMVPWDPTGEYDRTIVEDPARGSPAVVYRINTELPAMQPDYYSHGLGERLELTR